MHDKPANPDSAAPQPADDPQEDLYCLECAYNLRGLPGDPRRCPECGEANSVGDMRIPAGLIRKQVRRLETAPVKCVGWFWAVAFCVLAATLPWRASTLAAEADLLRAAFAAAALCSLVGWVLALLRFGRSCEQRSGWRLILWQMHVAAVLLLTSGFALLVGLLRVVMVVSGLGSGLTAPTWRYWAVSTGLCVVGSVLYRGVRRRLLRIRRELAVALAKQRLAGRKTR